MALFGWGMVAGFVLGLGLGLVIAWATAHEKPLGDYSAREDPPPDARPSMKSGVMPKPPERVEVTLNFEGVNSAEDFRQSGRQVAAEIGRAICQARVEETMRAYKRRGEG